MRKTAWASCMTLWILLWGCIQPAQDLRPPPGEQDFDATTVLWKEDADGFVQFSTNDPTSCGCSFLAWHDPYCDPMGTLEVDVKKMSGNPWAGFGLLFCLQDLQNFYGLVIDTEGDYAVFERNYGSWSTLIDWTYSDTLRTGFGAVNSLRIDRSGGTFTLSFNGTAAGSFADASLSKGYWGPFVDVYPDEYEDFPDTPVDVRFQLKAVSAILVQAAVGMETTEEGGSCDFTVVLGSKPAADVTLSLSCSDPSEAGVTPASLTFTPANWDVPRTVTATGVDDLTPDGDQSYSIATSPASSLDPRYDGFDAPDVSVRSKDNETYKMVPHGMRSGSSFGRSAAVSGSHAIVGAFDAGAHVGAAFVYRCTGTNVWDSGVRIVAPDGVDSFGGAVAIDGDYAVVGAPGDSDSGTGAGAAYVLHRIGENSWDCGVKLHAPDGQAGDGFGQSVGISGEYLIVGASTEDGLGTDAGAAYIFHRTGTNSWDGGMKVTASDGQSYDAFGVSVAIDGDYAVIGADGEDDAATNAGAAYVFHRTGIASWDSGTKIALPDPRSSAHFGTSVSISGAYALVGASYGNGPGAAYLFYRADTAWDTGTEILAPDGQAGDHFGWSVAIDADWAVVSALFAADAGRAVGAIYVYRRTGTTTWDAGTKVVAPDRQPDDQLGQSVGICGSHAIAVARGQDEGGYNVGAAYVIHY